MSVNNDPELDGKYLGTISKDFVRISDHLKEASYQIRKREFSNYPIFPVAKTDIPIGQILIAREDNPDISWDFYATYIDEFVQREIIAKDKEVEFKAVYKDPDEFCCLFVVDGAFTKFLFLPYPVD